MDVEDPITKVTKQETRLELTTSGILIDFYKNNGLILVGGKSFQIEGVVYYKPDKGKGGAVDGMRGHYICESYRPYHQKPKGLECHMEWYRFDDEIVTRIGPDLMKDELISMDERFGTCILLFYRIAPEETTISQSSRFD